MSEGRSLLLAYFRFHASVGIRVALRILASTLALFFAAFFILRPEFFLALITSLMSERGLSAGVVFTSLVLIFANVSSRRVCLGLGGWIRHLPAGRISQRRLAALAVFLSITPVLLVLAGLVLKVSLEAGTSPAVYLAGLPPLGLSAAQGVLPVKRRMVSAPLAVLAGVGFASGSWAFIAMGSVILAVSDLVAGPLHAKKRRRLYSPSTGRIGFHGLVIWRALRLRFLIPYICCLPALGFPLFFLSNNTPVESVRSGVLRFGGAFCLTLFLAFLANITAVRRPPWPWFRSLPVSAKQRILSDAWFLILMTIPLICVLGYLARSQVWPVVACLPLLSLYASKAIRKAFSERMGAVGRIFILGAFVSMLVALTAWVSLACLAALPFLLRSAVHEERIQKVSRWLELHHIAAGDTLSWSGR